MFYKYNTFFANRYSRLKEKMRMYYYGESWIIHVLKFAF
jgi:hypothetical protein